MKKILSIISFILILSSFSCCFHEELICSYEELSQNLIRIEYVDFELKYEKDKVYERNTIIEFNSEETEFILQELSKITYVTYIDEPSFKEGKKIVLVYETCELWFGINAIQIEWFDNDKHIRSLYGLEYNEELKRILDYADSLAL